MTDKEITDDEKLKLLIREGKKQDLISWDMVMRCEGETCPIFDICGYSKVGRCKMELEYMRQVGGMFYEVAANHQDRYLMLTIGFNIVPLYQQLLIMSKFELGVRMRSELESTDKAGVRRMHPVYKEIREIQRQIMMNMRQSGLFQFLQELGYMRSGKLFPKMTRKPKDGDIFVADRQRKDGAEW